MLLLAILGFANTLQASQDLTLLTANIRKIQGFSDRLKADLAPLVAGLQQSADAALALVNAGLADAAPGTGALTRAFAAAADALARLRAAVEGSRDCAGCPASFYFVTDETSTAVFSREYLAWLNGCP